MAAPRFASFEDFFPYYVGQHAKSGTRWLHFLGTNLGMAVAVRALLRRKPAQVLLFPAISYGLAWTSHFLIEGNKPATFGKPWWSLRGDFKMLAMMWRGRNSQLREIARQARSS